MKSVNVSEKKVGFMETKFQRVGFRAFFNSLVAKLDSYGRHRAEDAVADALQSYYQKVAAGDRKFLDLRKTEKGWWGYSYNLAKWNLRKGNQASKIHERHAKKAQLTDLLTNDVIYTPAGKIAERLRDQALLETLKRVCILRGVEKRNRLAYERCYLMNQNVQDVAAELGMTANNIYVIRHRIERCLFDEGVEVLHRVRFDLFNAAA